VHAYVPMSFAPGEAYQFDWSHETITLQGLPLTVKAAHMKLSHSRMPFVRVYFRETQELVFDAHDKAFQFYGGVCRRGIYDNMKTAVEAIFVGKARRYNRRFLQMCSHHLIEPVACTPASGWEKGQVENQVGNLRDQMFRPKPRVKSLAELNAWLEDQCIAYAQRTQHPEFKDRTIWDVFQDERASLMELRGPFDGFVEKAVRASTTCLIMADHNRYSVDARAAGRMVLVRSHAERIVVLLGDEVVADHPRQFRRDQIIYDPWHYLPVLMKKPGALRNGAPFKDWDCRPPDPGPRQAEATRRRGSAVRQGIGRGARSRAGRGRGRLRRSAGGRHRQRRRDPDRAGAPATAGNAAQHHHARCAAPEDRTRGRLWPLRQHKEGRLMERHEILEAMSELKLYGMRASFDEIAGKGLARRDEIYPLIASLIRAERTHRQARSISYRIGGAKFPVLKDLDKFVFADTPVDEGKCANSPPAHSWTPSATRSSSAAPAPAKPICASPSPRRSSAPAPEGASSTWSIWSINSNRRRPPAAAAACREAAALRSHRHRRTRLSAVQPVRRPVAVPPDQQALREHVAADHHQSGLRRLAAGVRRRQDDHRHARSPDPPLRYRRDRQRPAGASRTATIIPQTAPAEAARRANVAKSPSESRRPSSSRYATDRMTMIIPGTTWMNGSGVSSSSDVSKKTAAPTRRFVAPKGSCQRGRIIFSRYLKAGTARRTAETRWRLGSGRLAIRSGKVGAPCPAIISIAGAKSSKPAK
jgi:hypothetical protein